MTDTPENDEGLAARLGRAALRPAKAVARQGRDALTDEAERAIDGIMAGPLPEAVGRSLVEHHVVERVVAEALEARANDAAASQLDEARMVELVHRITENPALERMVGEAIDSRLTTELADRVVHSPAFRQTLKSVLSSPEVRAALAAQTAGFGAEMAAAIRRRARRVDDSLESWVRRLIRRPRAEGYPVPHAGLATRGTALVVDALLVNLVFLVVGALIGLLGGLFGNLQPQWLVGLLTGSGWLILIFLYFVGFWSAAGQTPGMRVLRLRVVTSDDAPALWRSFIRLIALGVAFVFFLVGFLPVLVDPKRRALQDFVAGTVVVYEPDPLADPAPVSSSSGDAAVPAMGEVS